ncbi:MAG: hypothetical protein ACRDK7_11310 [Solirubrobacteraceae bacterium]
MPDNNAISREHLDGRDSPEAEKPLKPIHAALALQHQAHDLALHRIVSLHRFGA